MSHAVVDARGLRFTYPDGQLALDGVDLHIEEGERVAMLGPNGAGKTTFALHLNGILQPSAGVVTIGGLAVIESNFVEIRRRVGMVFQDPDDQLFMSTVGQDVAFGPANLGLTGDELAARVGESLGAVDALHIADRAPHHLSGGERRRAAIATVLAMHPDVLVIDEPSAGLDPHGRRELVATLQALEITQLVITHDLPFALELCDRSVILDLGVVVADGPTAEILADVALLARHRLEMPFGYRAESTG